MGGDEGRCPTPRGFTALKPMMQPDQTTVELFVIAGWAFPWAAHRWTTELEVVGPSQSVAWLGRSATFSMTWGRRAWCVERGSRLLHSSDWARLAGSRRTDPLISGPWRGGGVGVEPGRRGKITYRAPPPKVMGSIPSHVWGGKGRR